MQQEVFLRMAEASRKPDAQERTIAYLAEHLCHFLRKQERVLICFLEQEEGGLSWLMEKAVLACGATPVTIGEDLRWKSILRLAFVNRVTAIIGEPLVILGLAKLKKHSGTPLAVRRVITSGYPCPEWMIEGISNGLDCEIGGCFALQNSGIVAGFACGHSWGVHIRETEYGVDVVDKKGVSLAPGELGEIVLYPRSAPHLRCSLGENARRITQTCRCGSSTLRLTDMSPGRGSYSDLTALSQNLHSWTSILDCRLHKGSGGLEIEIVCFQGEKLPKLPSAAKLVIRPWQPETDEPFPHDPVERFH